MSDREYEYDVALSFAGEDREYVEEVATYLRSMDVRVFYDDFESTELWGKDLYAHLDEIYRKRARFCVMFISEQYRRKSWTNHERKSAQARAFDENQEYILPARFDATEIPGVTPTTGYISLATLSPVELGKRIIEKLGVPTETRDSPAADFRRPRLRRAAANPYDQAQRFIRQLFSSLQERSNSLAPDGLSLSSFDREGRTCLRFVVAGRTCFSFDVWMGGIGGDASLAFYGIRGEVQSHSGSSNAFGEIAEHPESDLAIRLTDLSLLSHSPGTTLLTFDEFLERLWGEICDALEGA